MTLPEVTWNGDTLLGGEWARAVERARRLRGGGLVLHSRTAEGVNLRAADFSRPYVKLSGSTSPYSATPVMPAAGGQWAPVPGATALSGVAEENSVAGLDGQVVRVRPVPGGGWRFLFNRYGPSTPQCGPVCVIVRGCNNAGVPGATVSVTKGVTPVGTCVTGSNARCCMAFPGAGSYTFAVTPPAGSGLQPGTTTTNLFCTSSSVFINLAATPGGNCFAAGACCNGSAVPGTLNLTDANGGAALSNSNDGNGWVGCTQMSATVCRYLFGTCSTPDAEYAPSGGTSPVSYSMNCTSGSFVLTWSVSWTDSRTGCPPYTGSPVVVSFARTNPANPCGPGLCEFAGVEFGTLSGDIQLSGTCAAGHLSLTGTFPPGPYLTPGGYPIPVPMSGTTVAVTS